MQFKAILKNLFISSLLCSYVNAMEAIDYDRKSLGELRVIMRSKSVSYIHDDDVAGNLSLEQNISRYESSINSIINHLLPNYELMHSAVLSWKEYLPQLLELRENTNVLVLNAQAESLLTSLENVFNTTTFNGRQKIFSGTSFSSRVNLSAVPLDFDVNKSIAPFYIGSLQPVSLSLNFRNFTANLLSTDEVFENILRALMIIKAGRLEEPGNKEIMVQFLTSAPAQLELAEWKSNNFVRELRSEHMALVENKTRDESRLKSSYIKSIRKKDNEDRKKQQKKEAELFIAQQKAKSTQNFLNMLRRNF